MSNCQRGGQSIRLAARTTSRIHRRPAAAVLLGHGLSTDFTELILRRVTRKACDVKGDSCERT
jgi:hypothetical protein